MCGASVRRTRKTFFAHIKKAIFEASIIHGSSSLINLSDGPVLILDCDRRHRSFDSVWARFQFGGPRKALGMQAGALRREESLLHTASACDKHSPQAARSRLGRRAVSREALECVFAHDRFFMIFLSSFFSHRRTLALGILSRSSSCSSKSVGGEFCS